MAMIGKTAYIKLAVLWGKGTSKSLLVGIQLLHTLWISIYRILTKTKINLPYNPAKSLLAICPKDSTSCSTNTCSVMLLVVLLTIARK